MAKRLDNYDERRARAWRTGRMNARVAQLPGKAATRYRGNRGREDQPPERRARPGSRGMRPPVSATGRSMWE